MGGNPILSWFCKTWSSIAPPKLPQRGLSSLSYEELYEFSLYYFYMCCFYYWWVYVSNPRSVHSRALAQLAPVVQCSGYKLGSVNKIVNLSAILHRDRVTCFCICFYIPLIAIILLYSLSVLVPPVQCSLINYIHISREILHSGKSAVIQISLLH